MYNNSHITQKLHALRNLNKKNYPKNMKKKNFFQLELLYEQEQSTDVVVSLI